VPLFFMPDTSEQYLWLARDLQVFHLGLIEVFKLPIPLHHREWLRASVATGASVHRSVSDMHCNDVVAVRHYLITGKLVNRLTGSITRRSVLLSKLVKQFLAIGLKGPA
jgi:hypothetical protein